MGRRGPQPKLALIKRLEGNPGKFPRHVIEDDGISGLGEPFIPEHLPDDARGCIEVIKQSMPPGVYARLDSFLLASFAMAWLVHKRCAHEIANPAFQWIAENSRGTKVQSPWVKALNAQAAIMASLGDRLGLDPKARANLKLPNARQQRSKFEGLIGPIYDRPLSN